MLALRRYAPMGTIPIIRMPVRRMVSTARGGSLAASLLVPDPGITGVGVMPDIGDVRVIGVAQAGVMGAATLVGMLAAMSMEHMAAVMWVADIAVARCEAAAASTGTLAVDFTVGADSTVEADTAGVDTAADTGNKLRSRTRNGWQQVAASRFSLCQVSRTSTLFALRLDESSRLRDESASSRWPSRTASRAGNVGLWTFPLSFLSG